MNQSQMYELASTSVTSFSNMAAYRGGFEDGDDEEFLYVVFGHDEISPSL